MRAVARASGGRDASRKLLSLLVAVCNEEKNLPVLYERLDQALRELPGWTAEIIFIDDGSQDGSFAILRALHERDSRVKIVRLSRNFGPWNAAVAGVRCSSGDAVTWISADLQDPPEMIPQMVQHWEGGADVVWAARVARHDPWLRRMLAFLFYKLLRRVALPSYPPLGMDICLMDRRVARVFGQLKERNRFTQGLIMSLGFKQVTVPYTRERRQSGSSKWGSLPRLLKMGIDMIVGSSSSPIRFMLYAGILMSFVALVLAGIFLVKKILYGARLEAWSFLLWTVFVLGALNFAMLGVLGEYLWRVLEEVRGRPLYIVEELVGFGSSAPEAQVLDGFQTPAPSTPGR